MNRDDLIERMIEMRDNQNIDADLIDAVIAALSPVLPENCKHGKYGDPVYNSWANMIQRCTNPNNTQYHRYGGRGIHVCEKWKDFASFYADMGDPPEGMTLERIDNDCGYFPENCRWATRKEQRHNQDGLPRTRTHPGDEMTDLNESLSTIEEWRFSREDREAFFGAEVVLQLEGPKRSQISEAIETEINK